MLVLSAAQRRARGRDGMRKNGRIGILVVPMRPLLHKNQRPPKRAQEMICIRFSHALR